MCSAGASRTEIEIRGRNGGPTAGAHLPQKASLHLIRRDGRTPGAAGGAADAVSRRGSSLPPEDLARIMDMRAKSHRDSALSLGAAPLSRSDIRNAYGDVGDSSVARVPGQTPSAAAAAAVQNPFAFNT